MYLVYIKMLWSLVGIIYSSCGPIMHFPALIYFSATDAEVCQDYQFVFFFNALPCN